MVTVSVPRLSKCNEILVSSFFVILFGVLKNGSKNVKFAIVTCCVVQRGTLCLQT